MVLHSIHWVVHPSTTDLKWHHWWVLTHSSLSHRAKHKVWDTLESCPNLDPRGNDETRRYPASSWILWMTGSQWLTYFNTPSLLFSCSCFWYSAIWAMTHSDFQDSFDSILGYWLFIMNPADCKLSLRYSGSMGWYKLFCVTPLGSFPQGFGMSPTHGPGALPSLHSHCLLRTKTGFDPCHSLSQYTHNCGPWQRSSLDLFMPLFSNSRILEAEVGTWSACILIWCWFYFILASQFTHCTGSVVWFAQHSFQYHPGLLSSEVEIGKLKMIYFLHSSAAGVLVYDYVSLSRCASVRFWFVAASHGRETEIQFWRCNSGQCNFVLEQNKENRRVWGVIPGSQPRVCFFSLPNTG